MSKIDSRDNERRENEATDLIFSDIVDRLKYTHFGKLELASASDCDWI